MNERDSDFIIGLSLVTRSIYGQVEEKFRDVERITFASFLAPRTSRGSFPILAKLIQTR